MIAIISLGSNLGDRVKNLQFAIAKISGLPNTLITKISSVYETVPQLIAEQPDFLNAVIEIDTNFDAVELLTHLHLIESAANRERKIKNGPRTLDLDIVTTYPLSNEASEIELPHPRAHLREFVLRPWLEIDPAAKFSDFELVSDLLTKLEDQGVKKIDARLT